MGKGKFAIKEKAVSRKQIEKITLLCWLEVTVLIETRDDPARNVMIVKGKTVLSKVKQARKTIEDCCNTEVLVY